MKTISLKLPELLDAKLTAVAAKKKISKSKLVRQALDAYLNGSEVEVTGSLLELAGHLIGRLEGPGDLSYNKKHMEDFGR